MKLPHLPELVPVESDEEEEPEREEVDEPELEPDRPAASAAAMPNLPPGGAEPRPRVDDGYNWLREHIREHCLRNVDLNANKDLRESGKIGGPLQEGMTAFASLSAQNRAKIVRSIPHGKNALLEVIAAMRASKALCRLTDDEIGALLVNRLIMCQSQLPAKLERGEVYIDNRT